MSDATTAVHRKLRYDEAMTELPSVDDLISYMTRYKPAYPQTLRGANPEEIAELERLVGRELPPHYRQYLERMGHNDGGLKFGHDGYTDITYITGLYREINTDQIEIPPECIAVAGMVLVRAENDEICLEFGPPESSRVLFTSDGEVDALYAATFIGLLFRMGFATYPMNAFMHSEIYFKSDVQQRQVERAGQLAEQLGFVRHWFSDAIAFCGERRDVPAAIFINQLERMDMTVKIATSDAEMLRRVGSAFIGEFRLKRHWKLPL